MGRREKRKMKVRFVLLLGWCLIVLCTGGCLSSSAISTMGTAGGFAPVSFTDSGGGKGESYWLAHYADVIAAVSRAGDALSLEVQKEKSEEDEASFRFSDDRGQRIDLLVERHTDTVTSIRFDVGRRGSQAFGRLLARQIIFELNQSGAFLEDWSPEAH